MRTFLIHEEPDLSFIIYFMSAPKQVNDEDLTNMFKAHLISGFLRMGFHRIVVRKKCSSH